MRAWLDPATGIRYEEVRAAGPSADGYGLIRVTFPDDYRPAARQSTPKPTPDADKATTAALLRLVVS